MVVPRQFRLLDLRSVYFLETFRWQPCSFPDLFRGAHGGLDGRFGQEFQQPHFGTRGRGEACGCGVRDEPGGAHRRDRIGDIFEPQEVFLFIQKHAGMDDYDMYHTYNMGQDYAIFLPEKDVKKTLAIIKKHKFQGIDAGYVKKGEKQVVIEPKNITFKGDTLDLR